MTARERARETEQRQREEKKQRRGRETSLLPWLGRSPGHHTRRACRGVEGGRGDGEGGERLLGEFCPRAGMGWEWAALPSTP